METLVIGGGGPVSGLIEATSGSLLTAQLTGWNKLSAAEWKLTQPRSFPDDCDRFSNVCEPIQGDGFGLNGDSLATLPAISAENFGQAHPPNVGYARTHGRKVPKYFGQSIGPGKDGRERLSSSAPRTSPERRLRERFYRKQAEKLDDNLAVQAARQPRVKAPPASFGFHTPKIWYHCC